MMEYLSIGQMSALFGLNKQTLQYYDREGIFRPIDRNQENNYRMYRFDQVYRLALICYLRKVGFSIAQVKTYLNLHDSEQAVRELRKQSEVLKEQCKSILDMDEILQRRLRYVERQLKSASPGQEEIRLIPPRKYIPLGEEGMLYHNENFYLYPTIAFVRTEEEGKTEISFGAYLEPEQVVPVICLDMIETVPEQRFLCARCKGSHSEVLSYCKSLRKSHPELKLSKNSVHLNIVDQFIETDQNNYITEIQIPISE